MKKPNITKGDWNNEVDVVYSDKEGLVADCSYIKGKDIDTINAKAISAVPDMIDALIDNIKLIQKLRDGYSVDTEELNEHWTNTYYALIKPGCTE